MKKYTNGEKRELNLRRHYKEIKPKTAPGLLIEFNEERTMSFNEFRKIFKMQGDDLDTFGSFIS